jgi:hypothetical protein
MEPLEQGGDDRIGTKSGEAGDDVRPCRQLLPGPVEHRPVVLVQTIGQSEGAQNAIEIFPVKHVEIDIAAISAPDSLHGRLIFPSPCIGEG